MRNFPKSKGANRCQVLKEEILKESLRLTGEQFRPIIKKSKLLIQYKNIETLNFTIYPLTRDQIKKLGKDLQKGRTTSFYKEIRAFQTMGIQLAQ